MKSGSAWLIGAAVAAVAVIGVIVVGGALLGADKPVRIRHVIGRELGSGRTRRRRGFRFFLPRSAGGAREVEEIQQIFEQ